MRSVFVLVLGALLAFALLDLLRARNDRRGLLVLAAAVAVAVVIVLTEGSGAGLIIVDGVLLGLVVSMTTVWWERRKRRKLRERSSAPGKPPVT